MHARDGCAGGGTASATAPSPEASSAAVAGAPVPGAPAAGPASMLNDLGPIPGLAVSYEVVNITQPVGACLLTCACMQRSKPPHP
jgi:hypothetical protein